MNRDAGFVVVELEHLAAVARAIEAGVDARVTDPRVAIDIDRAMDLAPVPVVERRVSLPDVVVARCSCCGDEEEW